MNKSIFEKFFSIDELKASALVMVLFIDFAGILVYLFMFGIIPQGLIELALALIYSIAGVNALNGVKSAFSNSNSNNNTYNNSSSSSGFIETESPNSSIDYNNIDRSTSTNSSVKPKI